MGRGLPRRGSKWCGPSSAQNVGIRNARVDPDRLGMAGVLERELPVLGVVAVGRGREGGGGGQADRFQQRGSGAGFGCVCPCPRRPWTADLSFPRGYHRETTIEDYTGPGRPAEAGTLARDGLSVWWGQAATADGNGL